MRQTTNVAGRIAVAESVNPLQTKLSLIITDFEPNGNKEGIPISEKENIIQSALYQPIKINFNGLSFSGHKGAFPIGPITNIYETQYNGRDVIAGDAIIWNELYSDVSDRIKDLFIDGVGTSWEIYYDDADIDENGVNWLNGCVFAGTCIVETPAYGSERTKILAIAEAIENAQEVQVNEQVNELETLRADLSTTQDLLFKLYDGLDSLYGQTFEIEAKTVERDLETIANDFSTRIAEIAERFNVLKTSVAELNLIKSERDTLLQEKAEAEKQKKESEIREKLKMAGIEDTTEETIAIYTAMDENALNTVLSNIGTVKAKKEVAERKDKGIAPEPLTSGDVSVDEIVSYFNRGIK